MTNTKKIDMNEFEADLISLCKKHRILLTNFNFSSKIGETFKQNDGAMDEMYKTMECKAAFYKRYLED